MILSNQAFSTSTQSLFQATIAMSLKTLLAALFTDSSYCAECLTSLPINSLPLITTVSIEQTQFVPTNANGKTSLSKDWNDKWFCFSVTQPLFLVIITTNCFHYVLLRKRG